MIKTRNFKVKVNNNIKLEILRMKDINWYVESIFRPFFYEYLEFKPNNEAEKLKVKASLISLINEYKINNIFNSDIRLVIKLDDENVGGITIIPTKSNDTVELAYWVLPEYQRKGICRKAMIKIISTLSKKYESIDSFILTILSNNDASIKLAESLGFNYRHREPSKTEGISKITYVKNTKQ